MQIEWMKRAALGAAAVVLLAGTAQAALEDRDLDGDTVTDAFYDTDLKITWLRDADVNGGHLNWFTAASWADTFRIGGYDDWRLPTGDQSFGYGYCTGCEMGHLWQVSLGNPAGGPMTNTGSFQDLQSGLYWTGTDYSPLPREAWTFGTGSGTQSNYDKQMSIAYAMVVRDGDVAAVPEPESYALMLAGLGGLALARRRQRG